MTQQPGMRSREYVRKLPRLTKEQIIAASRQQAIDEDELEEDESYYTTRLPTSTRRYQGYDISPEQVYQSGNTRYHVRYVDVPKRKSRQPQLPPVREQYTEEVVAVPQAKRSIHPLARRCVKSQDLPN